MARNWRVSEVEFLRKNVDSMTRAEIANALGRTDASVKTAMRRYGISKNREATNRAIRNGIRSYHGMVNSRAMFRFRKWLSDKHGIDLGDLFDEFAREAGLDLLRYEREVIEIR